MPLLMNPQRYELREMADPSQRLAAALELDAVGGSPAWSQLDLLLGTIVQAHLQQPHDLELAARLFNLYVPVMSPAEIKEMLTDGLAVAPMDEQMVQQWLLPNAAVLIDFTQPQPAQEILELVPACYRSGPRWEQIQQGLELAQQRKQAQRALSMMVADHRDPEGQDRRAAQLRAQASARYVALAWPYINRYPNSAMAPGCVQTSADL